MQTLHKTRTNQINKHKQQKSRPRYTQNERLKQRTRSKPSAGSSSSSNRRRKQRRCCATYNKTCINKQQAKAKKTTTATTKTKKKNNKNKTTHGKTDAKEQHKKKQQQQKQRQSSEADDDDGNRQAKEKRWKKCTSKTELFPTAYDFAGQHWWLKRTNERTNERASERTNEQSDKVTKRRSFSRRRSKRCKQQTQRTPGEEAAALHALQSQPYLKERTERERERERAHTKCERAALSESKRARKSPIGYNSLAFVVVSWCRTKRAKPDLKVNSRVVVVLFKVQLAAASARCERARERERKTCFQRRFEEEHCKKRRKKELIDDRQWCVADAARQCTEEEWEGRGEGSVVELIKSSHKRNVRKSNKRKEG